jgi:Polyketide cyclase / dehydrase and lipid transport
MVSDELRKLSWQIKYMRLVKLAIISIIVFSLLITGISLFFPSHVRISKAIDISANKDSLLKQIGDPTNWKNWYPGADTSAYFVIAGKIKGIATGDKKALKITEVNDSSVLTMNVGPGSKKGESGWNIFSAGIPNSFTVQWYMDFHLRWYPWEKFSSLLLEKRYGPVMEQGLARLKALLEK